MWNRKTAFEVFTKEASQKIPDPSELFIRQGGFAFGESQGSLNLRKWLKEELYSTFSVPFLDACCAPGIFNIEKYISLDAGNNLSIGSDGLLYSSLDGIQSLSVQDLYPLFTTTISGTTTLGVTYTQIPQNRNLVYASPSGNTGLPDFRSLVASDLPIGVSGTTNYLSKFNSPTSITNSLLYDNGTTIIKGGTTALTIVTKDNVSTANGNTTIPDLQVLNPSVASISVGNVVSGVNHRAAFFSNYTEALWGLSRTSSSTGQTFGIWNSLYRTFSIFNTGNVIIRTSNLSTDFVDNGYKLDLFGSFRTNSSVTFTGITSATTNRILYWNSVTGLVTYGPLPSGTTSVSSFTDLIDVPSSYASKALEYVRVNAAETGLEFVSLTPATNLIGQTSGNVSSPSPITTTETWLGEGAGANSGNTTQTTFLGYHAGDGTNGSSQKQIAIGYYAGYNASNAYNSNFIGVNAGDGATAANKSNFIGHRAGNNAANAYHSTFLGRYVGTNATNADTSVFIGHYSGNGAVNAKHSIFIGDFAGYGDGVDNTPSGYSSIAIGDNSSPGGYSNSIAFGKNAVNTATNQFLLSSSIAELVFPLNGQVAGYVLTSDGVKADWQPSQSAPIYNTGLIPYGDNSTPGGVTNSNFNYDSTSYFNAAINNGVGDSAGFWANIGSSGHWSQSPTEVSYLETDSTGATFFFQGLTNTSTGLTLNNTGLGITNFNVNWLWPTTDGTNGQVLTTDGSGNLSFTTVGGSGLIYPNTELVFGDGTTAGGTTSSNLTFNGNQFQINTGGSSSGWGQIQELITSSGSEAGISLNNTDVGGLQWNLISTSNASGIGGGMFSIGNATQGINYFNLDGTGVITIGQSNNNNSRLTINNASQTLNWNSNDPYFNLDGSVRRFQIGDYTYDWYGTYIDINDDVSLKSINYQALGSHNFFGANYVFNTDNSIIKAIENNVYGATSGTFTIQGSDGINGANGGGILLLRGGNSFTGSAELAGDVQIKAGYNTFGTGTTGGHVRLFTDNTERVTLITNGYLGVNTTTPTEQFEVSGNTLATAFIKRGGSSSQFLKADGSVDSSTYLTSVTAHDLLSATHGDTTASSVTRGAIITGQGVSTTWSKLALGTTNHYLVSDGTDLNYSSFALNLSGDFTTTGSFNTTLASQFTGTITLPNATSTLATTSLVETFTNKTLSGSTNVLGGVTMTLGLDASYDMYYRNASGILTRLANGTTGQILTATTSAAPSWTTSTAMTNPMTTLGDIIYENATPAPARLLGNTSTTQKFLGQVGNGTISAAPTWFDLFGGTNTWSGVNTFSATSPILCTSSNSAAQPFRAYINTSSSSNYSEMLWTAASSTTQVKAAIRTSINTGGGTGFGQLSVFVNGNSGIASTAFTSGDEIARFSGGIGVQMFYKTYFGSTAQTSIHSTIQNGGSFAQTFSIKVASYTFTTTDYGVIFSGSTAAQTITLPTAASIAGRVYELANVGSVSVTLATTASETFLNVTSTPTTLTLAANAAKSIRVVSTGSAWVQLN